MYCWDSYPPASENGDVDYDTMIDDCSQWHIAVNSVTSYPVQQYSNGDSLHSNWFRHGKVI
jgi:hypothetical protein